MNSVISSSRHRLGMHHQWLSEDIGHSKLREHIANVIFMMKGAGQWDSF